MSATRIVTAAALSAAVLTVAAQGAGAAPGAPATENSAAGKHDRAASRSPVAMVRRAVSPYTDVAAAGEAGYVPQGQCEGRPQRAAWGSTT